MLNCTITSPQKTFNYPKIQSVTLPSSSGQIQILSNHAESFFVLNQGKIQLHKINQQKETIQITGGECYINANNIIIIL